MKSIYAFILLALLLVQCQVKETIAPTPSQQTQDATKSSINERSAATTFYVSTTGNDAANGSATAPWKTLQYAVTKTPANQDYTIMLSEGTFVENGLVEIPLGVNVIGAGIDKTIIKAASSFYYYPSTPNYSPEKFLISLNGTTQAAGNQTVSGFTIDGDGKKLHGGIFVGRRNNVTIDGVKVTNTHFIGIWLWDVQSSSLKNSQIINASWGSAAYCVGALSLASLDRVDISNVSIDENTGYGIKAIGPTGPNKISNTSIHDSRVSVNASGLWNSGSAPNFAIELYLTNLVGCQIYNNYIDNNISLVNHPDITSTGIQSIRVHHNILDMDTRAHGSGYGIELTVNDVEVDHNYFLKGTYGIVNWGWELKNWNIHHNTFYGLSNNYPGEMLRSQKSGLHNVKFYNNTVEFTGTRTMNVIGLYGGASDNLDIKNNLLIDNTTSYSYYANQLVHTENGATISALSVNNNSFTRLAIGSAAGTYTNNLTVDPMIAQTGSRPDTYYMPKTGSPLIDKGINVGYAFSGSAPDIGAMEFNNGVVSNSLPTVGLTSPTNNSTFNTGASVTITANASDSDGSITKVEFFNGSTKIGEDLTAPYSLIWTAASGVLTAKATDDKGATTISNPVTVNVTSSSNALPTISLTSPANNSSFTSGASVTITATASDSDGTISKVEFFNGSTKLGEDLTAPYSLTWTAAAGVLTAKATDDKGATSVSSSVTVNVTSLTNASPTVSLTGPANNSTFTSNSSVTITAAASDSDGTISKVEFFNGTTKMGEDLTAPYSLTWTAAAGVLTAKATDDKGGTSVSGSVTVTVASIANNILPKISLIGPSNNSTYPFGRRVIITAAASDDDGSISKVEFFHGNTKIGEDSTAPYSLAWSAAEGVLTAVATDNSGSTSVSNLVNVSILDSNTPGTIIKTPFDKPARPNKTL